MSPDSPVIGSQVVDAIDPSQRPSLRSVVGYTPESYTIHYIRNDVSDQYTDSEVKTAIEELRLATIERTHLNDVFKEVHGEFQCKIMAFEDAIELNFVLGDGMGIEIAFDGDCFTEQHTIISEVQAILTETAIEE